MLSAWHGDSDVSQMHHGMLPQAAREADSAWIWVAKSGASFRPNDTCASIPFQHPSDAAPEDLDVEQTSWEEERPRGHLIWFARS